MPLPPSKLFRLAALATALPLLFAPEAATRPRRAAPARATAVRMTEENLVPTEVFVEKDDKRFGYPNGFDLSYSRNGNQHIWKLTEKTLAAETAPVASPAASSTPAPTPVPLPPTADEPEFTASVAFVRPTFVTVVFAESPDAAAGLAKQAADARRDEAARPPNLAVMKLDGDAKIAPDAVIYDREFNLGPKSGGIRRASTIWLSRGNLFLQVDAFFGLKDGDYEAREDRLEERARAVAGYLLKKM